ncbi:hypothetical protein [Bdellovibrio sp. HCB337]|uniref:hypothetical protein n=1 Tax=Bdellovibrio sp. HCB337 TaxID=3394358 RepID=UPI0039A4FCE5
MPHPFFKIVKSAIVGSIVISLVVSALPEYAFASESKKTNRDLEKTLIQIRSQESLDQSITFLAAALLAWNPSLKKYNLKKILSDRVQKVGVMEGLVLPTITLIDMSYAAGVPRFGSLLNPMLNELAPSIAVDLNKKFQLPLDYKGESFGAISTRNSLPQLIESFQTRLDSNFNSQMSAKPQSADLNQKQDLFHQVLIGPGSYLKYRAGQLGNTDEAPQNLKLPGGKNPSEGGSFGKEIAPLPKGLFSNRTIVEYNTCTAECAFHAGLFGGAGWKAGLEIGALIPHPVAKAVAPAVGGVIGIGVGLNECSTSKACGGTGEPGPKKAPEVPKNEEQPKLDKNPKADPQPTPEPRATPEDERKDPKDPKFDFGPDSPRQQVDDNNNIQTDNDRNVATPQNSDTKEDQNRRGPRNGPPTIGPTIQRDQPKQRGPNYDPSAIDPSHGRLDPKRGPKVNPPVTDPMHGRL